jgi:hypothetical protein
MRAFWCRFIRRCRSAGWAIRSSDRTLLLQLILFASIVPLLMRLRPQSLNRILYRRPGSSEVSSTAIAEIVRHYQLARAVAAPIVRNNCLTRGMTLCYFLRRAGLDVSLTFGMGRMGDRFAGHCWLTESGAPFLEQPDPRPLYAEFFSIPFDRLPRAAGAARTLRDLTCP